MRIQKKRVVKNIKVLAMFFLLAALSLGLFPFGGTSTVYASGNSQLAGIVWQDTNGNGTQDEGEGPVPGIQITVSSEAGFSAFAETDEQGGYSVKSIPAGSYVVSFPGNEEFQAYSAQADIAGETSTVTRNIGLLPVEKAEVQDESKDSAGATISGVVWLDENMNGMRDAEESMVPNLTVSLYHKEDLTTAVASVKTDENGAYTFDELEAGSYKAGVAMQTVDEVEYLVPMKGIQAGTDNQFDVEDWEADPIISVSADITVEAGSEITGIDAGMRGEVQIMPMSGTAYTVDLDNPASGTGYSFNSTTKIITFSTVANGRAYTIKGGSMGKVAGINILANVETELVLERMLLTGNITLNNNSNVTMVVESVKSTIKGSIITAPTSTLKIKRLNNSNAHVMEINASGGNAGIGGKSGSSAGTIIIESGTLNINVTGGGAGIGGGSGGAGGNITISGGEVTVKAVDGAGIGGGLNGAGGSISITGNGNTVVKAASSGKGAGIGGSGTGAGASYLKIDKDVLLEAYSYSRPAIDSTVNNAGTAYYANHYVYDANGLGDTTEIHIRRKSLPSITWRKLILPLPGSQIRYYAYNTNLPTAEQVTEELRVPASILLGTTKTYAKIVRVADGDPTLYMTKTLNGYDAHSSGATYKGVLPVTYHYQIVYKGNNSKNQPDYIQSTGILVGSSGTQNVTLLNNTTTGFTAPANSGGFNNWNTQANGGGTAYSAGSSVTISSSTGSLILYAQWKPQTLERYRVYKNTAPNTLISSHHWLKDAVAACGTDGAYTIVATENDIDMSNTAGGVGGQVTIPASKTITLKSQSGTGSPYTITQKTTSIYGSGDNTTGYHFRLEGKLTLENIVLSGLGLTSGKEFNGGVYAIGNAARLTMNTGAVIKNGYNASGGGVHIRDGEFVMNTGATIENCHATNYGGGVHSLKSAFTMNGGLITGCTSVFFGGGVDSNNNSEFIMKSGATIKDCDASVSGGGVYTWGSTFTMDGGLITGCTAEGSGGGVHNWDGDFTINNGTITGCTSGYEGGGVYNWIGDVTINNGQITNCTSGEYGGGVLNLDIFVMNGGSITDCTAGYFGGGIAGVGTGKTTISGGSISGNKADLDGGGIYLSTHLFTMSGGSLTGNTATRDGGGIYTVNYNYDNPVPTGKYDNISITGTAVVSGNTSRQRFNPPVNHAEFTSRATNPFNGQLLNNDNINYRGAYVVTYKANNGTTQPDYYQNSTGNVTLPGNDTTGFTGPAGPPALLRFAGWNTKANGTGTSYPAGYSLAITGNVTLYAQWALDVSDVTISKTVDGEFADLAKEFTFTIYLENNTGAMFPSGTQFSYTGGVLAGSGATAPADGILTVESGGKATIKLSHGQTITIKDVPSKGKIEIWETADGYSMKFKDSLASTLTPGGDTGLSIVGDANRTFDFFNTRGTIPPGGISTGGAGTALLGVIALLAGFAAFLLVRLFRRRRGGAQA